MAKPYLIKYETRDGENEYSDKGIYYLDPDVIKLDEDDYEERVLKEIICDTIELKYHGAFERKGDYRIFVLYDIREITDKSELKTLRKYGV